MALNRCGRILQEAIRFERRTVKHQWDRKPRGRCRQLLKDVETELNIAENYLKRGKLPEAVPWFQTAAKSHGAFIWCVSKRKRR